MNIKDFSRTDLGHGFFLYYRDTENGRGGYHPVSMKLFRTTAEHGENTLVKEITDPFGRFLSFPGVIHGPWDQKLAGPLQSQVNFVAGIGSFRDGLASFRWMVQPDGFYYTDEDGFGAEDDEELWLYALINETGSFVTPFSDSPPSFPSHKP